MDLFDKCENFNLVDNIKAKGIYPYFHCLESKQGPVVTMEGKRRIMLGSNNYLGLTSNDEIIEAGIKALEKYGTGCSGSRFLNGTLDLHQTLESELATFLRKDDVCTFSTGFQSNLGIISCIAGRDDFIFCDRENHASIYDGCRLSNAKMIRFFHSDMADLEQKLQLVPLESGKLIITDGVFSMSGDICKLPEITKLAKKYNARVMVDDAHGLGVIGEGGRGTASFFGLENEVDIYMGTFSKSFASLGGYMAANKKVIDFVRHNSRPFIFSASITPSSCATALASLRILISHPEMVDKLQDLSKFVRKGLEERGVKTKTVENPIIPIVPIYTYDSDNTLTKAKELYDAGVYVNPVIPPAVPPKEGLLRTSYMATHTYEILNEAMDKIKTIINN